MISMRNLSCALCLLALASCGSEFEPSSRISKLRLLAVAADRPYARPGEAVALEALAHDPLGRALTFGWATCTAPSAGTVMGCLASLDAGSFKLGTTTHTVTIDPSARSGPGGMVGVITVVCPGALTQIAGPIPFRCRDGARDLAIDEFEIGMKRLVVRTADRNANPRVDAVLFDGRDWPESLVPEVGTCAEEKVEDCPSPHRIELRTSGAEAGVDELGVPFSEQLIVQYYATEGTFEKETRTGNAPESRWIARSRAAGTTLEVFLVARDDRGGSTWARRRVKVR